MHFQACKRARSAFTLIEVLVVVAIIAIMVAILLPSLAAARVAARISVCQANMKQMGTMVASYQMEFQGYVPVIYDYEHGVPEDVIGMPAEFCWLSVALRRYTPGTQGRYSRNPDPINYSTSQGLLRLPFDPSLPWSNELRILYETKYLNEFFICPFVRGQGPQTPNPIEIDHRAYRERVYGGRWESYSTWDHYNHETGLGVIDPTWEMIGGEHCQYQTATFNRGHGITPIGKAAIRWELKGRGYKVWGHTIYAASISPSGWTAIMCRQGEFNSPASWSKDNDPKWRPSRANVGSHRRGDAGGTNTMFADTHVEWVKGTRIGGQ